MEYRYANNQPDRLPALAAELDKIPATVIVSTGGPAPTLALKAATTTIPIVFAPVPDPVRSGLVASMNWPGGNITGIAALTIELDPKRLELLHELAPPGPFGVLLNPHRPDGHVQADAIKAAGAIGRPADCAGLRKHHPTNRRGVCDVQRTIHRWVIARRRCIFLPASGLHIVVLATRYGWPAMYQWREFVDVGGLASFGASLFRLYRQVGIYVARILKGKNLPICRCSNRPNSSLL